MKLFALAATLATARQRRAMTVNEQGGSWEIQEAQVSDQVEQVSNQRGQFSNQNGDIPSTCEESYAKRHEQNSMWYYGSVPEYQNMDTCDFTQLIRIHVGAQYKQFKENSVLMNSWIKHGRISIVKRVICGLWTIGMVTSF